jgi:hypothetical protein
VLGDSTKRVLSGYTVTFAVDRAWKGEVRHSLVLVTGAGSGDCGFPFEEGKVYLVFARHDDEGALATLACSRTAPVTEAIDDIRNLGFGRRVDE